MNERKRQRRDAICAAVAAAAAAAFALWFPFEVMYEISLADVMEAETVFVLAIFSVFFVVGASLFYYACCVTDNEEAVKKLRESLKRRRSSVKVTSAEPHPAGSLCLPTFCPVVVLFVRVETGLESELESEPRSGPGPGSRKGPG